MRAHMVQLDIVWEDKPANHARVDAMLGDAAVAPGDLIVLPELFDTGFSMRVERTNDASGESLAYLRGLAGRTKAFIHGGLTVMGSDGWARNRAVVIAPDGRIECAYDKVHPFSFGREPEKFKGGDTVTTWSWPHAGGSLCVCPAVCYDLRFPELFRRGLELGAEVFVIGANWPRERTHHWRALLIARAIENQAWVVGVNRAGDDPHLSYAGGSIVVDHMGSVVADAGEAAGVISVEIDADTLRAWRERFPAWRDRRL